MKEKEPNIPQPSEPIQTADTHATKLLPETSASTDWQLARFMDPRQAGVIILPVAFPRHQAGVVILPDNFDELDLDQQRQILEAFQSYIEDPHGEIGDVDEAEREPGSMPDR